MTKEIVVTLGRQAAPQQAVDRAFADRVAREREHDPDQRGGEGLELGVAVGVLGVGRPRGEPHADQPDDVRGAVEQRVEAVGLHGRGVTDDAVDELGERHGQVEREDRPRTLRMLR